jgi:hypothetical protein
MSIIKVTDFNLSNVSVSEIKKNKAGGEAVYLNYEENNVFLQTDVLNVNNNESNFLEVDCSDTKFLDVIKDLEKLALETFGNEEFNLRSVLSETNSVKLNIINDKTTMYDSKKNTIDSINSDVDIQILIQPVGIWCKNQEYGLSFVLHQVRVLEKEDTLHHYAFVDDENDFYDIIPNDF